MLCNIDRARDLMARDGLDGLLASHRVNVYYLSDYWGALMRIDRDFSNFAVLPRREGAPAGLVVALSEMHGLVEAPSWVPNVVAFGRDPEAGHLEAMPELYPTRDAEVLTEQEQAWNALVGAQQGKLCGMPIEAVKRIVVDAGLEKARIGTDDPRLANWLASLGLADVEIVDATNLFREIRIVKTPREIELLGAAARANARACDAATRAVTVGATVPEIEKVFNEEWARQGGAGIYILLGTAGGMRHRMVKEGDPFMVDALGTYAHYHGDIGRTAIVGEPRAEFLKSYNAIHKGWEAARASAKPGVDVRELTQLAVDVTHREGFPHYHLAVAHSIGLEHTDNPAIYGNERPDGPFVLQENMVVSFDMPHHEFGWAHMHLEDTLHITKDGCALLADLDMEMMVLPT